MEFATVPQALCQVVLSLAGTQSVDPQAVLSAVKTARDDKAPAAVAALMAVGLVAALSDDDERNALEWLDAVLDELRQLAHAYPEEATVRELLAEGLAVAIAAAKQDEPERRDALLEELRELAGRYPNDGAVREQWVMGLFNMEARPGNTLVAVRNPHHLYHLRQVLAKTDTTKTDLVVMTAQPRPRSFGDYELLDTPELFGKIEQELFTSVVNEAEKEGKRVSLIVVPATDPFEAILATAQRLNSSVIFCGLSPRLTPDEQGKCTGDAWERLPEPRPRLKLVLVDPSGTWHEYSLGPHLS